MATATVVLSVTNAYSHLPTKALSTRLVGNLKKISTGAQLKSTSVETMLPVNGEIATPILFQVNARRAVLECSAFIKYQVV